MMQDMKTPSPRLSRRQALKAGAIAGGGLVVAASLGACSGGTLPAPPSGTGGLTANAFLQITPDNEVHFYLPRAEMGQGVFMGLTTLVAEELDVDPDTIRVHHAPVHPAFDKPGASVQYTGGSSSLSSHFMPLRQTAANVREAVRQAAAGELGVPADSLVLRDGQVRHGADTYTYGRFADAAALRPLPDDAALKSANDFTVIGHDRPRLDAWDKVTGQAQFALDVDFPGLHRAVLRRCPVSGGTVKAVNTEQAAAVAGVAKIVPIFNGIAVVAERHWQAKQAADLLEIDWHLPDLAAVSSPALRQAMEDAMTNDTGQEAHAAGRGADALGQAHQVLEATYWAPYLAHATMEPMNCTARIADGRCDIWVGSQMPDGALGMAAHHAGLPRDRVTVHPTYLGGGFGRRISSDFVAEAVAIARASGLPVQLVWSREEDMRYDRYRPVSLVRFRAGLDRDGRIDVWTAKRVGPNVAAHFADDNLETVAPEFLPWSWGDWASKRSYWLFENLIVNPASVHGLFGDYDIPHQEIRHATVDPGLPIGYWRSVGHSFNAFFAECFLDELAQAAEQDPLAFRLAHNGHDPRMQRVLRTVAERAAWGDPAPGRFQGIAAHNSFETAVAQVVEISLHNGAVKLEKVTCAVDCGTAVNPDVIRAQMESGIVFGLSAALYGEITLEDGAVVQGNFDDYEMLRLDQTPEIEVAIVPSTAAPTGVGEPGLPPLAPALGNAIFAATGRRLRELPLASQIDFG